MDRWSLRHLGAVSSDSIVGALQTRQHLRPHAPLGHALTKLTEELDVCPAACGQAVKALGLDESAAIGRLRGAVLIELGQTIDRLWHRAQWPQVQTA